MFPFLRRSLSDPAAGQFSRKLLRTFCAPLDELQAIGLQAFLAAANESLVPLPSSGSPTAGW
jgi:hypothetical protein